MKKSDGELHNMLKVLKRVTAIWPAVEIWECGVEEEEEEEEEEEGAFGWGFWRGQNLFYEGNWCFAAGEEGKAGMKLCRGSDPYRSIRESWGRTTEPGSSGWLD